MTGVHRRYLIIGNQKNIFAGLSYPSYHHSILPLCDNTSKNRFDALESDGQTVRILLTSDLTSRIKPKCMPYSKQRRQVVK